MCPAAMLMGSPTALAGCMDAVRAVLDCLSVLVRDDAGKNAAGNEGSVQV